MRAFPAVHSKQRAFIDSLKRFIVLRFGRRCVSSDTLVWAERGLVAVKDLNIGEMVWSYDGQDYQLKQIEDVVKYSVDSEPKPMIQFKYNGETIRTTYDHPFYYNGDYVPIYQLVWRDMDTSQRQKLDLLREQYGTTIDDELEGVWSDESDETSSGREWLSEDGDGLQDGESSSRSSREFRAEPREQAAGESSQQHQDGQSGRESNVGNSSREPRLHDGSGTSDTELGRKVWDAHIDRETGEIYQGLLSHAQSISFCGSEETSAEVASESLHGDGYSLWQDVEVLEVEDTYSISVADNNNFFIGENALLTHNTGKSYGLGVKVLVQAIRKQGQYFIIAPTFKQAKDIFWEPILKQIIPPEWILRSDEREGWIELKPLHYKLSTKKVYGFDIDSQHDMNAQPSRIRLAGAQEIDNIRGMKADGVVADEIRYWKNFNYAWSSVIRAMVGDTMGWVVFSSTPQGVNNPFYDLCYQAQHDTTGNWELLTATALDNPWFPVEEWEVIRDEYKQSDKMDTWAQEYLGEFRKMSAIVYKSFDRSVHCFTDPDLIPNTNVVHMLGMDFGWRHPFAAVLAVHDPIHDLYVIYDEIAMTELDFQQIADVVKSHMGNNHFSVIVGDSASPTNIATLAKDYSIAVKPAFKNKDTTSAGIRKIEGLLRPSPITGKPRLMFYLPGCPMTVRQMENYAMKTDINGNVTETPLKEDDDLPDALRYMIMAHKPATAIPPKATKYYSSTGRLLS